MRRLLRVTLLTSAALALVVSATATPAAAHDRGYPTTINLPDGFLPEGIATGPGPFAYFGSRADGRILRVDLRTGRGEVASPPVGTASVGLKTDRRGRLFVAGGGAGNARVIDTRTGAVLASYQFASAPTFVNDVVLTERAAYFTDSQKPVLYKLMFGRFGELPATFSTIALSGDFAFDPTGFNLNGIARTPDGRGLIVVQSGTGLLFRVDPDTGLTRRVDVGGETFVNGDGLLLLGRTLYVVQNRLNLVAGVRLNRSGTAGTLKQRVTDPRFDVPTTVAAFDGRLYLPNARFTTPQLPTTTFTAVAIPRF